MLQPLPVPATSEGGVTEKPTRLAIGVEGGFDGGQEKQEIEETLSVVTMPELTSVPWPCDQLPPQVCITCTCVYCVNGCGLCVAGVRVSAVCPSLHSQHAGRYSIGLGWGEERGVQVIPPHLTPVRLPVHLPPPDML